MANKSGIKLIGKELKVLSGQNFSEGQVRVVPHAEDAFTCYVILDPTSPPHAGYRYVFVVHFNDEEYPSCPVIACMTPCWHPNIDPNDVWSYNFNDDGDEIIWSYAGSNICLNILDSDYDSRLRIIDFAHALLWLLYNPEFDDCLVCEPNVDDYDSEVVEMTDEAIDFSRPAKSKSMCCFDEKLVKFLYGLGGPMPEKKVEAKPSPDGKEETPSSAVTEEKPTTTQEDAKNDEGVKKEEEKNDEGVKKEEEKNDEGEDLAEKRRLEFKTALSLAAGSRIVMAKSTDGRVNSMRDFLHKSWNNMPKTLRASLEGVDLEIRASLGEPTDPIESNPEISAPAPATEDKSS